jgi:hypothetical protein
MDLSSTYENRISLSDEKIEINMNDVIMEKKMKKTPIVEIEGSKNQKKEIEVLNEI